MGKAQNTLQQVEKNSQAKVTVASVVTKDKKQGRPAPLNTVGFLKACSKGLGIGPHAAMHIAEHLYQMGYMIHDTCEATRTKTCIF